MKKSAATLWILSASLLFFAAVIHGPALLSLVTAVLITRIGEGLIHSRRKAQRGNQDSSQGRSGGSSGGSNRGNREMDDRGDDHGEERDWKFKLPIGILAVLTVFMLQTEVSLAVDMNRPKGLRQAVGGYETIVVPGAGINGTNPSLYLAERLDGAIELLREYPGMKVVVSGARSPGESLSESEVMKNYLLEQGIFEGRIYKEDKARNTLSNFRYSLELIRENKLNERVIVVTNSFHNLRCMKIAAYFNLEAVDSPVASPLFTHRFFYTLKESLSFLKLLLETGFRIL